MNDNIVDYSIEEGVCLVCGKTLGEIDEAGEDVIQHLEKHVREDKAN